LSSPKRRRRLRRLSAVAALAALSEGWTLVDTRDGDVIARDDGYSSSLAAVRLHELGFTETTDVIGGFGAWLAAGLPVER
jgi:rhodanese-related sulfurtransferase